MCRSWDGEKKDKWKLQKEFQRLKNAWNALQKEIKIKVLSDIQWYKSYTL